jgi:hypothetical protein
MRIYEENGPEGRGRVEVDPKTGKKLKVQSAIAESMRSTAMGKAMTSTKKKIDEVLEEPK